jgi:hypothetical protein
VTQSVSVTGPCPSRVSLGQRSAEWNHGGACGLSGSSWHET